MSQINARLEQVAVTLAAHPDVRRAGAAFVSRGGRDVIVGAAEVEGFTTGPVLRDYLHRQMDQDTPTGVLVVMSEAAGTGGRISTAEIRDEVTRQGEGVFQQPPTDDVEFVLMRIWSDALSHLTVSMTDDFLESGGDSLAAIALIGRIEEEFEILIDTFDFIDLGTPRAVAGLLKERGAKATSAFSLVLRAWEDALGSRPAETDVDFFALGGNSVLAARLVSAIDDEVEPPISLGFVYDNRTVIRQALALSHLANDQASGLT
jgi:acyl carrier protein